MDRLTFRSPKNPDCPSAFGFRTVWIFLAPSGQNFHTGPAFGGKNVTDQSDQPDQLVSILSSNFSLNLPEMAPQHSEWADKSSYLLKQFSAVGEI